MNGLLRLVAPRLLWAAVTCIAVIVITFLMVHLVPGSPVTALMGRVAAPPGAINQLTHDYGLDQSVLRQLVIYIGHVLQGNLGYSFSNQQSVTSLIIPASRHTLLLMIPSLILAAIFGVWLGSAASQRPSGWFDTVATSMTLVQYSLPVFWVGQILILVFAVNLGWLPAQGMETFGVSGGTADVVDIVKHMILPVLTITVYYMAIISRVSRSSLIEMRGQDFVLTARAKGLSANRVRWVHVLRNAAIPIVTVMGYSFGEALTGTILTETVFGWPGIGSLFIASITKRDYPVLEGVFIVTALTVILANLVTDVLYGIIDPRLRAVQRARD